MANPTCEIRIPSAEGLPENELTVGRPFELSCAGLEFPAEGFDAKVSDFAAEEQNKFALKKLEVLEQGTNSVRLKVVSYTIGKKSFNLTLSDGKHNVGLGPVTFDVISVLPADQSITEPYGPMGPLSIAVPWIYWIIFVSFLTIVISQGAYFFRRRWQKKTMLQRSGSYFTSASPVQQFYFHARGWERKYPFFLGEEGHQEERLKCLEEILFQLKIYIVRSFQVPALDWSTRLILKDIKKNYPEVYKLKGIELKKNLAEIEKLKQSPESLKSKDLVQVLNHNRLWIEKTEQVLQKRNSKSGGIS